MRYFIFEKEKFKVEIVKTNSPSNYNRFARFYKIGEKMPLLGYTCKESTTINEVISHFKLSYKRYYQKQFQEF